MLPIHPQNSAKFEPSGGDSPPRNSDVRTGRLRGREILQAHKKSRRSHARRRQLKGKKDASAVEARESSLVSNS